MHESSTKAPKNGKPAGAGESSSEPAYSGAINSVQAQMMPAYALGSPIQTKLTIGHPDDPYEREADSVAQRITNNQPVTSISAVPPNGLQRIVQRQVEPGDEERENDNEQEEEVAQPLLIQREPTGESAENDNEKEEELAQPLLIQREPTGESAEHDNEQEEELAQPLLIQREPAGESPEEDPKETQPETSIVQPCGCKGSCSCGVVQRSAHGNGPGSTGKDAVKQAIHQQGSGESFRPDVQHAIESQTGFDMSGVRIHRDNTSQNANRSLNARAFTHGNDIWLGAGESPHDLSLMAHEATHVVQQNAGGSSLQTIQRKPSDYQHPEDGGAVRGRLNERFEEVEDSDEAEEHREVDPAEKRRKSSELRGETRPDVDRPAQEQPRVEQRAAAVERETETPPEPVVEPQATAEPAREERRGEAMGAAEQAAALAQQAFAAAGAQPEPPSEVEVQPPEVVMPVDSAGEPLAADPEAEGALANLADRAQYLREQGTLMRAQAAEGRSNAEVTRGNLARVTSEVTKAEEGITTAQTHTTYRREVVGQAQQALGVSEQKAATVAAEAPDYQAKADEGREDSGPMSGEANALEAENTANTPEDEDAAEDSREQGQKMNQVSGDAATMDGAIAQTRARATSLGADAAQAAEMNTQTRGTIDSSTQQLDQLDERLTQHSAQASQARAQVQSMASQPDDLRTRSNQLEQQGQDLIASSFEIEGRLHDVQSNYAAGTASVPAIEPWEGEVPEEESSGEGAIQLTPSDENPSHTAAPGEEVGPVSPVSIPPTSGVTVSTVPPAPSVTTTPTPVTTAPAASVTPSVTSTPASQPGTESEPTTESEAAPETEEQATEERAAQPAASSGEQAAAPAIPEAGEAGAAEQGLPELAELEPVEPERVDVNRQLPPWLTGINPESQQNHDQAADEQQNQRREEIAAINRMARGRPISQLGAGERLGIAMRLVGGRYFGMVSNIRWPGWGGLARTLLDPRSMLTGATGGLNMILNAGSSLLSAERWRRDPLGNLLKSSADIATGLAIILGSITALAGLVAAVMGALILVTFGFAAPIAIPVISVCTTIITTVGGWTIVVGKIALVLQALSLIKNLIDAATAQTASDLQREAGEIQSDINGGFAAAMSIVGAKGAQAGIGRLNSRVARTVSLSRRVGGARNLARLRLGTAPGRIARSLRRLPGRIGQGVRQRIRGAREAITSVPKRIRQRISSVRERFRRGGRPNRSAIGPHGDTLRNTGRKSGRNLTQHEVDAELDVVRNTPPRRTVRGEYDAEVTLPNGHTWRRNSRTGTWCRFSKQPDICHILGTLPGRGSRRYQELQSIGRQMRSARSYATRGNYSVRGRGTSLASVNRTEADFLGKRFVGDGHVISDEGIHVSRTFVGQDGNTYRRVYRPPQAKPQNWRSGTGVQANFETQMQVAGEPVYQHGQPTVTNRWQTISNGHIDIE